MMAYSESTAMRFSSYRPLRIFEFELAAREHLSAAVSASVSSALLNVQCLSMSGAVVLALIALYQIPSEVTFLSDGILGFLNWY
jgi:hypothetical protein